mmetsp:Transcript_44450/g.115562  ORF Transcript_44450/g.115562 Transcript_44450/m.115562 type:complete len:535 (-) Transcript_44450:976-2580(-)
MEAKSEPAKRVRDAEVKVTRPLPKTGKRRKTNRDALAAAIADVQAGKLSLSGAAKKHDVSRSTLHRHLGDSPIERGRGPPTVLLPAEEDDLVEKTLRLAKEGRPLKKCNIYDIVEQIVKGDEARRLRFGANGRPGNHWWHWFCKRHPEIVGALAKTTVPPPSDGKIEPDDARAAEKYYDDLARMAKSDSLKTVFFADIWDFEERVSSNVSFCGGCVNGTPIHSSNDKIVTSLFVLLGIDGSFHAHLLLPDETHDKNEAAAAFGVREIAKYMQAQYGSGFTQLLGVSSWQAPAAVLLSSRRQQLAEALSRHSDIDSLMVPTGFSPLDGLAPVFARAMARRMRGHKESQAPPSSTAEIESCTTDGEDDRRVEAPTEFPSEATSDGFGWEDFSSSESTTGIRNTEPDLGDLDSHMFEAPIFSSQLEGPNESTLVYNYSPLESQRKTTPLERAMLLAYQDTFTPKAIRDILRQCGVSSVDGHLNIEKKSGSAKDFFVQYSDEDEVSRAKDRVKEGFAAVGVKIGDEPDPFSSPVLCSA